MRRIFFCILLIAVFTAVQPALALEEVVINGDFKYGNFSGWELSKRPPSIETDSYGNHAVGYFFTGKHILQQIDFTGVDMINYDIYIMALGPFEQTFDVYIGKNLVKSYENEIFSWRTETIDTSYIEGVHPLIFSSEGKPATTMNIYIDNISGIREPGSFKGIQNSPLGWIAFPVAILLSLFIMRINIYTKNTRKGLKKSDSDDIISKESCLAHLDENLIVIHI